MVDRVVLDVQLAHAEARRQPVGADERREAGVQAGPRLAFDRQQLAIAPEVLGRLSISVARDQLRDRVVVVGHLERAQALVADPERGGGEGGLAEMAAKAEIHGYR